MTNRARLASAVAMSVGLAASAAQAGFSYSTVRTNNVTLGGQQYDRVVFYAKNDGAAYVDTNGTTWPSSGSRVLAMEFTLTSTGSMRYTTADLPSGPSLPGFPAPPGDGRLDVDLLGSGSNMTGAGFVKYNPDLFQFVAQVNPSNLSTASYDAVASYVAGDVRSILFTGAFFGGASNAPLANAGQGFPYLTVLTAPGSTVTAQGLIGSEIGGAAGGSVGGEIDVESLFGGPEADAAGRMVVYSVSAVPEPTVLAGVAAVGVLALRRRAATC